MSQAHNLQRFITAQESTYANALSEIKSGRKRSHWMWFIFPQIGGLGHSETAKFYAVKNLAEATAYLQHPVLGTRLAEICDVLLQLPANDAHQIFGTPDDLKLKSSMTLFASVPGANLIFEGVLKKFFNGIKDERTLAIIKEE